MHFAESQIEAEKSNDKELLKIRLAEDLEVQIHFEFLMDAF